MNDYRHFEFVSITQLGKIFGVGRKVMGKWLANVGLRTADLDPSDEAMHAGLCKFIRENDIVFVVWHRNKTIEVLKEAGYIPVYELPQTLLGDTLNGPFVVNQSSEDGYQVVNGDGTVSTWIRGEKSANDLGRLMNFAYGQGWFGGKK